MLDKVFKAYDIRAIYPDPLNEDIAVKVGEATGIYLKSKMEGRENEEGLMANTVVVGRDMRKSAPSMSKALIEGFTKAGMNVIDLGMVDTPFVYFAINYLNCAGGVQCTASHNPPQYIGFKISGEHALPIGSTSGLNDIKEIAKGLDGSSVATGTVEERDLWAEYTAHVMKSLKLKRKLKVVVDASNGMAGKFMPMMFDAVEDLDIIPINFEITGEFVHEPNPLVPENMQQTVDGVKELGADLGVCFDGDADRCMVTDEKGNIVGCDHLGALMGLYYLQTNPGDTIVYDLRSSKALKESIEEQGGKTSKSRVGHVFMKKELRETNAVFGAELSGHMYYRDNFYTDSGVMTFAIIASILSESNTPMSEMIAPLIKYPQSGELNYANDQKDETIEALRSKYADVATIDDLDGITIDAFTTEGWWMNVRKSNTEPVLRLNMEAKDQETLDKMMAEVTPSLGEPHAGH